MDNQAFCKGEALILSGRINEVKAAILLLEIDPATPQDEVVSAVILLKQFWHCMASQVKSKLSERRIALEMDMLFKLCGNNKSSEDSEGMDLEQLATSIVQSILPVSAAASLLGVSDFDATKPTFYDVLDELRRSIYHEFDLDDVDPSPEIVEKQVPYVRDIQAWRFVLVGVFAI